MWIFFFFFFLKRRKKETKVAAYCEYFVICYNWIILYSCSSSLCSCWFLLPKGFPLLNFARRDNLVVYYRWAGFWSTVPHLSINFLDNCRWATFYFETLGRQVVFWHPCTLCAFALCGLRAQVGLSYPAWHLQTCRWVLQVTLQVTQVSEVKGCRTWALVDDGLIYHLPSQGIQLWDGR